jgi:hypothetical protein
LPPIIAELKGKRETAKTELDAYVRSTDYRLSMVHVLNKERRNLEDDLAAIDARIAEVNRRLEAAHAEESRAEEERLRKKQIADYLELDSLARRMADKIIEIERNNRHLLDLGASRPFNIALRAWRKSNPMPLDVCLDAGVRRAELQSFVSERKIVVGLNYADSALAEVIALMRAARNEDTRIVWISSRPTSRSPKVLCDIRPTNWVKSGPGSRKSARPLRAITRAVSRSHFRETRQPPKTQ